MSEVFKSNYAPLFKETDAQLKAAAEAVMKGSLTADQGDIVVKSNFARIKQADVDVRGRILDYKIEAAAHQAQALGGAKRQKRLGTA